MSKLVLETSIGTIYYIEFEFITIVQIDRKSCNEQTAILSWILEYI